MSSRPGLHPRNRHQGEYDFGALVRACPELAPFVRRSPDGRPTVDFADGRAVRALNRALLALQYGIRGWVFPEGFLCPPVPGRADLIHHLAGLLGEEAGGRIPTGPSVRVLDLGVGASCIFPLIGHAEYGWRFVGTDVDVAALASAAAILKVNGLEHVVALRLQPDRSRLFRGVVAADERFDLCLCNPPFHASAAAVRATAREKWRKLGKGAGLNFGGRDAELWCEGGELGFQGRNPSLELIYGLLAAGQHFGPAGFDPGRPGGEALTRGGRQADHLQARIDAPGVGNRIIQLEAEVG